MVVLKEISAIFGTAEVNLSVFYALYLSAGQHGHSPSDTRALQRSTERTCLILLSVPNVLATALVLLEQDQAHLSVLGLGITSFSRMTPPDWVRHSYVALFQLTTYLPTAFITMSYHLSLIRLSSCVTRTPWGKRPCWRHSLCLLIILQRVCHIKVLNTKFCEYIGTK